MSNLKITKMFKIKKTLARAIQDADVQYKIGGYFSWTYGMMWDSLEFEQDSSMACARTRKSVQNDNINVSELNRWICAIIRDLTGYRSTTVQLGKRVKI